MKSNTPENKSLFRIHQAFSPEEVLAAGGTTAFGIKTGKNNDTLIKALQGAPAIEPFTEEEWAELSKQIAEDK